MAAPELAPLVERDAELSALAAAADVALPGEGRLVIVEVPAGIGKTRLLRAVRDDITARGSARVLAARATELEAHVAFGVVRQLLDPVVFDLAEPEREQLFTGAAGLARAVLGGGELVAGTPDADRYSTINALDRDLRELAAIEHIGLAYISQEARARLTTRIERLRDPGRRPRTPLEAFVLAGRAFDAAASGLLPAAETADLAARATAGDLLPIDAMEGGYGMLIAA